jgi:hypothetical protein
MKKALATAVIVLCLVCFAQGCRSQDAPEPTAPQTAEPTTLSEPASETTETTETTEPAETTEVTEVTESTETTTAESASTASAAPQDTATTATTTTTTTTTTTATTATTAAPPSQTQTTRKTLIDRWREFFDPQSDPEPDPAFFDNAVFVGDSVTQGLRNYTTAQRNKGNECLGSAQFLCYGSMSYTNALEPVGTKSMHPSYKGRKVSIEEGVQLCGAGKVFIMLGMNDFSAYREETWKQNVCTLLDRISEKNPDVSFYLQSVTPIIDGKEHGRFSNANIQQFNEYLQQVCSDRGCTYVDIYHVLADDSGHLKKSYCGDPGVMGIHMSNSGSAAWVQYLQSAFCGAS